MNGRSLKVHEAETGPWRERRDHPCHGRGATRGGRQFSTILAESEPLSFRQRRTRSEEHTSELQSLMRISYAVFCLKKKKNINDTELSNPLNIFCKQVKSATMESNLN